jgi:hypothetical protein
MTYVMNGAILPAMMDDAIARSRSENSGCVTYNYYATIGPDENFELSTQH